MLAQQKKVQLRYKTEHHAVRKPCLSQRQMIRTCANESYFLKKKIKKILRTLIEKLSNGKSINPECKYQNNSFIKI